MNKKVVTVNLISTFILLCTACGGGKELVQAPVVVKTSRVTAAAPVMSKEFPFISKPLRSSELSFRVSGPIDSFDVYAGNHYKQNSVIAAIDPRDFRLRYESADAAYRRAKADYERVEALYRKDNVSASNYEQSRASYIAAKAACDTALNELNDTQLRAPFDGYVGQVYIEKFQDVKASQPVISFVDISKLKIEVFVTQDIVFHASKLKTLSLTFDARPDEVFVADIVEYSKNTTPNNLSYLLTALLPNSGGSLPAGMSGRVFFDIPNAQSEGVLVPQTALCHRPGDGDYVWVVDSATMKVMQRRVMLGKLQADGLYTVLEGLNPDEEIAISGLRFLSDGMNVKTENVQPKK